MAVANMVPASLGHRPPALLAEVDLAHDAAQPWLRDTQAARQIEACVPPRRLLRRALHLLTE